MHVSSACRTAARRAMPITRWGLTAFACAAAVPAATSAQTTAPAFDFRSQFWPNLHHFLYVLGRAEAGLPDSRRLAVAPAPLDTLGSGSLSAADREAWRAVVAYYARQISPKEIGFSDLVPFNYTLSAAGGSDAAPADLPAELASALERAAPIYRRVWWSRHDAANRVWIDSMRASTARHGAAIAATMARAFRRQWPASPIAVEVVAYANWGGAYVTDDPPLIHISSTYVEHRGTGGLEQLHHEAGHLILDSVVVALRREAERQQLTVAPGTWRDVSHWILFFTAGEATSEAAAGHTPYAVAAGVWTRGDRRRLPVLRSHWAPYLRGEVPFDEAIRNVVRELVAARPGGGFAPGDVTRRRLRRRDAETFAAARRSSSTLLLSSFRRESARSTRERASPGMTAELPSSAHRR